MDFPKNTPSLHSDISVGTRVAFRHSKSHPLVFDIVIVDEVSMVDFAMMAKLMDAMGESASGQPARLVLLGDRDQLASVDAGTVLADICGPTVAARVEVDRSWAQGLKVNGLDLEAIASSDTSLQLVDRERSMADAIVQFDRTYRFTKQSAIGRFASACIAEDFDAHKAIEPLISDEHDAHLIEYDDEQFDAVWAQVDGVIKEAFELFCRLINLGWTKGTARFPTQEVYWRRCIEAFDRFRILCTPKRKDGGCWLQSALPQSISETNRLSFGLKHHGNPLGGPPQLSVVMITVPTCSMKYYLRL